MTLPNKKIPDLLAVFFAAVGLIAGIILIVTSSDSGTQFRGAILALACAISFGMLGKKYNARGDDVIKAAVIAALVWGIAGFLVGDFLVWQLAFPVLNFDLPWTNFGRLHLLHTSLMIFAFCGNALLASSLYALQQTCGGNPPGKMPKWDGTQTYGLRWRGLSTCSCFSARLGTVKSRASTWRTGSSPSLSLPSEYCTS
ncbi:MAG: cbb3-type cytochrome c oxidase subunit I [Alphaproteobacteria bacterium]